MLNSKQESATDKKTQVVRSHELPLSCPTKAMELWSSHPKVYLPIEKSGVEVCPYCGTRFVLQND
ncbi:MAG: zinc-finger domain-containing protein [Legionellales bacterium]